MLTAHTLARVEAVPSICDGFSAALALRRGIDGSRAEWGSDPLPVATIEAGGRQMQHQAAHRGLDPQPELQQPLVQRTHLGVAV